MCDLLPGQLFDMLKLFGLFYVEVLARDSSQGEVHVHQGDVIVIL